MDLVEILVLQPFIILLSPLKSPCPISYKCGDTLLLFPYWNYVYSTGPNNLLCNALINIWLRSGQLFTICIWFWNLLLLFQPRQEKQLDYLKACLLFQTTLVCPIRDSISTYRLCPAFYYSYVCFTTNITHSDRHSEEEHETAGEEPNTVVMPIAPVS